jgi:TPR repeat protein
MSDLVEDVPAMPWLLVGPGTLPDVKRSYEEGHHDEALALWRALVEKGDCSAQNNMGVVYARGEGVAQDKSAAIGWFRLAAEQDLQSLNTILRL